MRLAGTEEDIFLPKLMNVLLAYHTTLSYYPIHFNRRNSMCYCIPGTVVHRRGPLSYTVWTIVASTHREIKDSTQEDVFKNSSNIDIHANETNLAEVLIANRH